METTKSEVRLTEWTTCGGCAAKWGAGLLRDIVGGLPRQAGSGALLVGLDPPDDAAVLGLSDDLALVSTIDFFPPLVDDADEFGTIAAANACSDIFAMGGQVILAVSVAAFPESLPPQTISTILGAATRTVREAGGVLAGGHTIRSAEPIFGLAVQGTVHPERIWTKAGATPGQVLALSKPLGTGVALASGDQGTVASAIASMRLLNRRAAGEVADATQTSGPGAATDVTGFGLIGHLSEVAQRSGVQVEVHLDQLPLLAGVAEAAAQGVRTGGDARNRQAFAPMVRGSGPEALEAVAYDPQTSGGLLVSVSSTEAAELVRLGWTIVGEVTDGAPLVCLR